MVKAKLRKKYSRPKHPWQVDRIKEEAQLKQEYGYKNKKEMWKVQSTLRNFRAQARRLIPLTDRQAQLEKKQLIQKLVSLGIVKEGSQIEDVLGLTVKDLFERRIQTIMLRKKMANSIKQARQFITHGHVTIGAKKITSPSYLVKLSEENEISFAGNSSLISELHPERQVILEKDKKPEDRKKPVLEEKKEEEAEEKEILKVAEEIAV